MVNSNLLDYFFQKKKKNEKIARLLEKYIFNKLSLAQLL